MGITPFDGDCSPLRDKYQTFIFPYRRQITNTYRFVGDKLQTFSLNRGKNTPNKQGPEIVRDKYQTLGLCNLSPNAL